MMGSLGSPMRREMCTLHARNSHLTASSKHCRRESIRPRARQLVILEYDLLCIISVTQVKRSLADCVFGYCFLLFQDRCRSASKAKAFLQCKISAKYNFT
jgi:hypothetical protein